MTRLLQWSAAARRDLIDIWIWKGRENPEAGDATLDIIQSACQRLVRFPHLGPPFPRIAADARKLSMGGYLALYRVTEDAVVVVRVVDQRRLLELIRFEED